MEEDRYTRITLRIPKELHAKLQEASDATSKSMNAEIVARLEESFTVQHSALLKAFEMELVQKSYHAKNLESSLRQASHLIGSLLHSWDTHQLVTDEQRKQIQYLQEVWHGDRSQQSDPLSDLEDAIRKSSDRVASIARELAQREIGKL